MANYSEITNIETETMLIEEEIMILEEQILEKVANNRALLAATQVRDVVQSYKKFCNDVMDKLGENTPGSYSFSLDIQLLPEAESRLKAVGFKYAAFSHKVSKMIILG